MKYIVNYNNKYNGRRFYNNFISCVLYRKGRLLFNMGFTFTKNSNISGGIFIIQFMLKHVPTIDGRPSRLHCRYQNCVCKLSLYVYRYMQDTH